MSCFTWTDQSIAAVSSLLWCGLNRSALFRWRLQPVTWTRRHVIANEGGRLRDVIIVNFVAGFYDRRAMNVHRSRPLRAKKNNVRPFSEKRLNIRQLLINGWSIEWPCKEWNIQFTKRGFNEKHKTNLAKHVCAKQHQIVNMGTMVVGSFFPGGQSAQIFSPYIVQAALLEYSDFWHSCSKPVVSNSFRAVGHMSALRFYAG